MIDLSHTIHSGMPVYPGDPSVDVHPALTLDADGVAVARVSMGSHSGTHLDAPAHTVQGGRTLEEISLAELTGEAIILRFNVVAREAITVDEVKRALGEVEAVPRIVMIHTGWDRFFGEARYLEHPHLDAGAVDLLWRLGMRILAVDTLSPDRTPLEGEPFEGFPVHDIVLGRDGLIVENLTGLDQVQGNTARVGVFPLKLGPVDGAPVRAVAFETD